MLLDEPFAGIDPLAVGDIQQLIRGLKERGIGVLISDHNVRETLTICDRASLMFQGRLILTGTPMKSWTTNRPAPYIWETASA